jgi:hypothetical protein
MILNSISKFLSRIYAVNDKILYILAPSWVHLENENNFGIFCQIFEILKPNTFSYSTAIIAALQPVKPIINT